MTKRRDGYPWITQTLKKLMRKGIKCIKIDNLPVNWPKLLGPFSQHFFDVYVFGMSFYTTYATKKSDINFILSFRAI